MSIDMNSPCVIGIDVGTTNLKTVLVDSRGGIVAQASVGYEYCIGAEGRVTQDTKDWWDALDRCFLEMGRENDLDRVQAVALSCQGETLVCCDEAGQALAPAISWMDTRAASEVPALAKQRTDWYRRTGKPVAGYSSLTKIYWLQKHDPALDRRTRRFCQVADYLVSQLTGRWICDINNASFTNYFNIHERTWDAEICEMFGLSDRLPEIGESGALAGPLKPQYAERWGLPNGVSVVLGGHDQGCAALGMAPPEDNIPLLSTGTAWVIYFPIAHPYPDPDEKQIAYCHAQPGMWCWLAAYSGGGVLDTYIDRFCSAERQKAELEKRSVYDRLVSRDHLSNDLFVIPYLFGANSPENDATARMAILGIDGNTRPEQVVMGILESICFETRRNLDLFARLGSKPERLRMAGGAGRNPIWSQMVADACGLPIDVADMPDAAALGAAFLAGQVMDLWPKGKFTRYPGTQTFTPQPEEKDRLEKKYRQYLHLLELDRSRRRNIQDGDDT